MDVLSQIYAYPFVYGAGFQTLAIALLLGGLAFHALVARPLEPTLGASGRHIADRTRGLLVIAGLIMVATAGLRLALQAAVLSTELGSDLSSLLRTIFGRSLLVQIGTALSIALVALTRLDVRRSALLTLLFVLVLSAATIGTQATAALEGRWVLIGLHALHWTGTGVWLGSLPFFLGALAASGDPHACARLAGRYAWLAGLGVLLAAGSGTGLAIQQTGTVAAVSGTVYGLLCGLKGLIALVIVAIGLANLFRLRHLARGSSAATHRLVRLTEVQVLLAIPLLLLAATLTTQPDPQHAPGARPTLAELSARLMPRVPNSYREFDINRYGLPGEEVIDAARSARAAATAPWQGTLLGGPVPEPGPHPPLLRLWSEATHHLIGGLLVLLALFAMIDRAENIKGGLLWPLLLALVALAILVRADVTVWPTGPEGGPLTSLTDPAALEHRAIAIMLALAALAELLSRLHLVSERLGGSLGAGFLLAGTSLLLVKAYPLVGAPALQAKTLIHVPLICLGLTVACGRWLEVRLDTPDQVAYGWLWTWCVLLAGALLLLYHAV